MRDERGPISFGVFIREVVLMSTNALESYHTSTFVQMPQPIRACRGNLIVIL